MTYLVNEPSADSASDTDSALKEINMEIPGVEARHLQGTEGKHQNNPKPLVSWHIHLPERRYGPKVNKKVGNAIDQRIGEVKGEAVDAC